MKKYEICTLKSDERVVVLANSYVNPLSNVMMITMELSKMKYTGEVLFDLLMSNGFSPNRFLKIDFDGSKFLLGTSEVVSHVENEVLIELGEIYYLHPEWVEQSSLPAHHKDILKKKLITVS